MRVQKVVTLDEKDNIILKMLIEDARVPYTMIAQETHLSDVAVKKRVDSMRKHSIIELFTVVIRSDIDLNRALNVVTLDVPHHFKDPKSEESADHDCYDS